MALKYGWELQLRFQEEIFYSKEVEKVAQRSFVCPILGRIQGQVGWDPGQPDLVVGSPAQDWGLGTRCYLKSPPT